jgi:hypothetical protein
VGEPFLGRARLGDLVCTVSIGDPEDPGWLGQVTSGLPVSGAQAGRVTLTLAEGPWAGFSADAHLDAAGALRGERSFTPPNPA